MKEINMFVAFDGTEFDNILDCKSYEDEMEKDLCFYDDGVLVPLDNIICSIDRVDRVAVRTEKALNSLNKILDILDDNEYYEMFKMIYTTGIYKYKVMNESYFKLVRAEDVIGILSEDILGVNYFFHDKEGYWWYKI